MQYVCTSKCLRFMRVLCIPKGQSIPCPFCHPNFLPNYEYMYLISEIFALEDGGESCVTDHVQKGRTTWETVTQTSAKVITAPVVAAVPKEKQQSGTWPHQRNSVSNSRRTRSGTQVDLRLWGLMVSQYSTGIASTSQWQAQLALCETG